MKPTRVLFVCTGNICRSPTAEGVARAMAAQRGLAGRIEFDSAGTTGYHVGDAPDRRAIAAAKGRGYDLSKLRGRRLSRADFDQFDLVLAMDAGHLQIMREICPPELAHRLRLFLDFHPDRRAEDVPDPYYGGPDGFDHVLDLIETATMQLLDDLSR